MNKEFKRIFLIGLLLALSLTLLTSVGCTTDENDDDEETEQTDCDIACQLISACTEVSEALGIASTASCVSYCQQQEDSIAVCVMQSDSCKDIAICTGVEEEEEIPPLDDDDDDDNDDNDDNDDDDTEWWDEIQCPENPDDFVDCATKSCGIAIGDTMANFSLKDIDGNCVELYDYLGDVVLLDMLAAWCPGCKTGTPVLQNVFQNVYEPEGFTVVQLMGENAAGDAADWNALSAWHAAYDFLTFPVVADPKYGVAGKYNTTGGYIPFYWLVDQDATIIAKIDYYYPAPPDFPGSIYGFVPLVKELLGLTK